MIHSPGVLTGVRAPLVLVALLAWLAATSPAASIALNPGKLAQMDRAITLAIATNQLPGGVLWLESQGQTYLKSYGSRALLPNREPMTDDTIFDTASLTKVLATTPSFMLLLERQRLKLTDPVRLYIPEFTGNGKEAVTLRHLLTHTSGLRPGIGGGDWRGYAGAIAKACAERLQSPPGTRFCYSDINFFVLGEVVQRASGSKLQDFVKREIYSPLKMSDTCYLPSRALLPRIAPTQKVGGEILRGVVHDPTARNMGGVAGHAGIFTTAADLARYARMLLRGGELDGVRIFKPETVALMTSVQTPDGLDSRRGLGWDIDSGFSRPRGLLFPVGSYGHTGFTGTSLWIDPFSQSFWIFLANRVHPDGRGNILPLQATLATLAAEAIDGFDFAHVTGALPRRGVGAPVPAQEKPETIETFEVLNGIDVLVKHNFAPLRKLRVGLITNHTGTDRRRKATLDLLHSASEVQLKALFSPEHGIRGQVDEKIGDTRDEQTGLPIYSLYGERRAPAPEQLADLDALVFDIQDIGCRFYTYISTMGLCMEAATKAKLKFFVLDRANPINGTAIEGPLHHGPSAFTAYHSIPLRYAMTAGELARMFNAERGFAADLVVIPLEGWTRDTWFDQTSLPWSNPSPNMRNLNEATLYPGVGLLETALSVGRGTDTPFELVGAPYVDDTRLALELNRSGLSGIRFVPIRFTPTYSVFKDKPCAGVYMVVTDRNRLQPVDVGITIALVLQRLYPAEFALDKVNSLLQDRPTIDAIRAGKSLAEIKSAWASNLDSFKQRRQQFLLYR